MNKRCWNFIVILLFCGSIGFIQTVNADPPPCSDITWVGNTVYQVGSGDIFISGQVLTNNIYTYPYPLFTSLNNLISQGGIYINEAFTGYSFDSYHQHQDCSVTTTKTYNYFAGQVPGVFPFNPPTISSLSNYSIYAEWSYSGATEYAYFILEFWNMSGAKVEPLGGDSVKISWTSTIPTKSRVKYGISRNYTYFVPSDDFDANLATAHSETLTGLSVGSTYYFGIVSKDNFNNSLASEAYAFTLTGDSSLVSIYYLDGTSGSDVTGDGSSDHPWATFGNAIYQLSLLDNAQAELRVSQGTYTQEVLMQTGLRIKGGYPTLYSVPTTIYGKRDTDWIEKHRNPRRYVTIIDPNYWYSYYLESIRGDGANNWMVDGFTVYYRRTSPAGGIGAASDNAIVSNNIVIGISTGYGIQLAGSNDTVLNNVVTNFESGLRLGYTGSSNMVALNNSILNCSQRAY